MEYIKIHTDTMLCNHRQAYSRLSLSGLLASSSNPLGSMGMMETEHPCPERPLRQQRPAENPATHPPAPEDWPSGQTPCILHKKAITSANQSLVKLLHALEIPSIWGVHT